MQERAAAPEDRVVRAGAAREAVVRVVEVAGVEAAVVDSAVVAGEGAAVAEAELRRADATR